MIRQSSPVPVLRSKVDSPVSPSWHSARRVMYPTTMTVGVIEGADRWRRLPFLGRNQSDWTFETTGMVDANAENVMRWWFHPDRLRDVQSRMEHSGNSDVSVTQPTTDGVRMRIARWKDRQGWDHFHRVETNLTLDGIAAWDGGAHRRTGPAARVSPWISRSRSPPLRSDPLPDYREGGDVGSRTERCCPANDRFFRHLL
jgi:hypothetical protein